MGGPRAVVVLSVQGQRLLEQSCRTVIIAEVFGYDTEEIERPADASPVAGLTEEGQALFAKGKR